MFKCGPLLLQTKCDRVRSNMSLKIALGDNKNSQANLLHPCGFLLFLVFVCYPITCLDSYDLIIVGGGTAGCALARRLSENGAFTVLLLESGGFPKDGMEIPGLAPSFVHNPDVTFRYPSLPQLNAARQFNGNIDYITGRMLGGTSSLNYLHHNRGHVKDYDLWSKITKDESWKYENMLKYFKKSETYHGDFPSDQHGDSGPITVSRPKYAPGLDYWLDAGKELGYPVSDPNGPQQRSFGPVEFSKHHGRRDSSYTGYLLPVLSSTQNLHILINTNVTKVVFNGKTAIAVEFQTLPPGSNVNDTSQKIVYANKEIILCAGVIGSALLLQRSGIGPEDLLDAAKIPVVQNLPVGMQFQDHVVLPIHLLVNNASVVVNETRDFTRENLELFKINGDGPYSTTRGGIGQAFVVSSSAAFLEGEGDWPDIQITTAQSVQPYLSALLMNTSNNTKVNDNNSSAVPMAASVFLARPKSRGSVYINPKDVHGLPLLDVGFFSNPMDMIALLDGVKAVVNFFEKTASYKRLGARVVDVKFPACQKRMFKSDQYWKCYIKHASQTGLRAGGTCRMGYGTTDPNAVVDSRLRVIGVTGLRVVDASIMPVTVNSNPQAAIYGIAEKAADLILNY